MRRLKTILALVVVVVAVVIGALFWSSSAESGRLGVVVAGRTTNSVGAITVTLEITNRSPHRVCLPGFCQVESRAAANLVEVPIADVWIKPGEAAHLSVAAPNPSVEWRVAVQYYSESPWNRLKIRLGTSTLGPKLPSGLFSVQGGMEWSLWIN